MWNQPTIYQCNLRMLIDSAGYDVSKANRYIQKLFENIGTLVFERLETAEKSVFQITAVESHLRELLKLLEVGTTPSVCFKCILVGMSEAFL